MHLGDLHIPKPYFISNCHLHYGGVLLRFIMSSNTVAAHRFVSPHLIIITILIAFFLLLLLFLIALAGISIRGEVTHVSQVITCGVVV